MSDKGFCVTVTSALALVAFVLVMRFLPEFVAWQGWNACGEDACTIQAWMGAISGWAAAAGALVAAVVTIRPLREQVREAKRQSDFIVGDADPEFVLLRNRKKDTVKLRITNWNRRSVMVDDFTCIDPDDLEVFNILDSADNPSWSQQSTKYKEKSFRVDGWFDRSAPPDRRFLIVVFAKNGLPQQNVAANGSSLSALVYYRIVGQIQEHRVSQVTALEISED